MGTKNFRKKNKTFVDTLCRTSSRPRAWDSKFEINLIEFGRNCSNPCSLSLLVTPLLHFIGRSSPIWRLAPGSFFSLAPSMPRSQKRRESSRRRDVAAPPSYSDPFSPVGHRRSTRIAAPTPFLARQSSTDAHVDTGPMLATSATHHAGLTLTVDSGHREPRRHACITSPAPQ